MLLVKASNRVKMHLSNLLLCSFLGLIDLGRSDKSPWSPITNDKNHYLETFRENDGYFLASAPSNSQVSVVAPPVSQNGDDSFVIGPSQESSKHRVRPQPQHKLNTFQQSSSQRPDNVYQAARPSPVYREPVTQQQQLVAVTPDSSSNFKAVIHEPKTLPQQQQQNRFNPHKRRKTNYQRPEPVFTADPVFNHIRPEPLVQAPPVGYHNEEPSLAFKASLLEDDPISLGSYHQDNYLSSPSNDISVSGTGGSRKLETTGKDHLYYDDIYPKRVPNKIHQEWLNRQKKEQELQRLREREHGRRWRRYRARQRARRRKDFPGSGLRPQQQREQRARSHYSSSDPQDSSLFRSLLGVKSTCLSEDLQFPCTFTPNCWMSGGVPTKGCDSLLYSCCVAPGTGRKVG